ncbi:DUF192 domain-containing protein [Tepidicella baoligensis]|uniref:DUF192 domain-containing protein n=1 Tax=Tepidicella baoligensis TaxID=2707016 RepID=UPI001FE47768|nr:DUF192 domain-containing protein [Tepidicella baoligensis]
MPSPPRIDPAGRWHWLLALGLALAGWLAWPAAAQQPQLNLPRVQLQAGMHLINAQVANTHQQRAIGLMWRRDMAPNEGMLFVFEQPQRQCFWMQNTYLPLTAAFIEDDGTIVNLADMQPLTTDSHCSAKPVRFVLEMHQGWFAKRGIQAGDRLRGDVFTPR